ncbi:aromatic ring-hydroxylating dioxygenase subunit alpha [Eoetvoesiella caeni]|uniref:Vanillate O-demethylase monooxygenase subunit n=1 Tax=Eoetvoesiella caeni TaxID=645616 RepID=A0A366H379_9BURK|nr:aromatic ring-hydroxylating dioxygenase subunit alpha [Eoetvoesiella caeni]MCI2810655.1 aromatic ring-hydroxylating dioxygenase subunit alpha [Eoetvoesiella caeni]NYT56561.1 aromatic ring-hydroxylating dioxygenase subunit alpha [Eoetvoesiella caeni]RBP36278.1 vanillate O-demethylase monooxygenase subunit [Eoetvoesiella caeni]
MSYLKNAWYVAALANEVDATEFFHRKILDTSILIYRKEDGQAVALHDRCPHRFAPLHLGKRLGDDVVCLYHALRFDCSGKCTHNPHGQGHIPKAAQVKSFPLVERFGFLWIWMGDEAADLDMLPDFGELETGHPNSVGYTYMHMNANYELIIDNVMDLSHIDHVHGEIITTRGQLSPQVPQIKEKEKAISARWEWKQTPAMMIFANFLPEPKEEARHYFDITWTPPANIQLSVGAVQGDKSLDECIGQYDLHTTTPETENSTHYFFATRRNHNVEDAEYNAMKIKAMHEAFITEDGPIIQAVQDEMGTNDFFGLNPVLMSNDVAPVKVRRLLKKLIDEEATRKDDTRAPRVVNG